MVWIMNLQEHISQEELDELLQTHTTIDEPKTCIKTRIAEIVASNVQAWSSATSQCSLHVWVSDDDISKLFKKAK